MDFCLLIVLSSIIRCSLRSRTYLFAFPPFIRCSLRSRLVLVSLRSDFFEGMFDMRKRGKKSKEHRCPFYYMRIIPLWDCFPYSVQSLHRVVFAPLSVLLSSSQPHKRTPNGATAHISACSAPIGPTRSNSLYNTTERAIHSGGSFYFLAFLCPLLPNFIRVFLL